jgi:predicted DNA-binding transcriptional regulator AlpA
MSNTRRRRTRNTPTNPPSTTATPNADAWTAERIRELGATTDLRTAGQIFGLSANTAYELVRRGRFPVPVIRAGRQYRIPVEAILALLSLPADPPPPTAQSPPPVGT